MSYVLDQQQASGHDQDLRAALQAAELPIDDLEQTGRVFFRFADQGRIVGFGGMEPYGDCAPWWSCQINADAVVAKLSPAGCLTRRGAPAPVLSIC